MDGMKSKIIARFVETGKRHRRLAKPVIAVLALFLTAYYGARGVWEMLCRKKFRMRIACLATVGVMLLTQMNMNMLFAATSDDSDAEPYSWYTADENADVFYIGNASELKELASLVNGSAVIEERLHQTVDFAGKTVRLTDDIDLTGVEWVPIGKSNTYPFMGNFDGDGHTVSGLMISGNALNYHGLFGYVIGQSNTSRSVISNIKIKDCNIIAGGNYIGGVAGYASYAKFENITVSNTNVSGIDCIGGVVGWMSYTSVERCSVDSNVLVTASGSYGRAFGIAGYLSTESCTVGECTDNAIRNYTGIVCIGGQAGDRLRIVWDKDKCTVRLQYNMGGSWSDYYFNGGENSTAGNSSATALYFEVGDSKYEYITPYLSNYAAVVSATVNVLNSSILEISSDGTVLTASWNNIAIGDTEYTFDYTMEYNYNGEGTFNRRYIITPHGTDLTNVKIVYGGDTYFDGDDQGYDYAIWSEQGTKMLFIKRDSRADSPAMYISSNNASGYYSGLFSSGKIWAGGFENYNRTNNGSRRLDEAYYLRWDVGNVADESSVLVTAVEGVDLSNKPVRVLIPDIPPIVAGGGEPNIIEFVLANVTDEDYEIVDIEVTTPDGSPIDADVSEVITPIPVPSGNSTIVPVTIDINDDTQPHPQKVNVTLTVIDDEGNETTVVTTVDFEIYYTLTYDFAANGGYIADYDGDVWEEQILGDTEVPLLGEDALTADKDGWKFIGWNTDADAHTALESVVVSQNTTLYAIYKKTLTGTFYANDGTGDFQEKETDIYNNESSGIVRPDEPSREGYVFDGWYTEAEDGDEAEYDDGGVVISADETYYAHWKEAEPIVTPPDLEPEDPVDEAPKTPVLQDGVVLPDNWTNSQFVIPLTLKDDIGVTELWVSVDNGEYEKVCAILTVKPSEDYDYYPVLEGSHSYRFIAKDGSGNASEASELFAVRLDTAAPTVDFASDGKPVISNYYDTAPDIVITVADVLSTARAVSSAEVSSGIAYVTYRVNDSDAVTVRYDGEAPEYIVDIAICADKIPDGESFITVTAADNAGNVLSDVTQIVRVKHKNEITLEVRKGGTSGDKVGKTVMADEDGNFVFEGLPYGVYSLVIKRTLDDGTVQTVTRMVEVKSYIVKGKVTLPDGNLDTVVEINQGAPELAVEGLDKIYNPDNPASAGSNGITAEDLERMKDGADLEIRMIASKLEKTDAADDVKAIIDKAGADKAIGLLMDLSVYKTVMSVENGSAGEKLTDIPEALTVVMAIPEAIRGYKDYAVVRVHDGIAQILDTDYDSELETLTFESDKFSTYAVIYTKPYDVPASYLSNPDPDPAFPVISFWVWLSAIMLISMIVIQDYTDRQRAKISGNR